MDNSESSTSTIIFIVVYIIISIVITFIIWYISGSVSLSLGLFFVLFIIGLIIYYFFFSGTGTGTGLISGIVDTLFGNAGTPTTPTNCNDAQQNADEDQYGTCLVNCVAKVGNCSDNGNVLSCDRKAVAECEKQTCKSDCFPGKELFFPLYGIGQSFTSTCEKNISAGNDPLFTCLDGCVKRTSSNSSEYCPCMNTNCEDIPIACNYLDPNGWRVHLNCPSQ